MHTRPSPPQANDIETAIESSSNEHLQLSTSQISGTAASPLPPRAEASLLNLWVSKQVGQIDPGIIVQEDRGSFESLRRSVAEIATDHNYQYLTSHSKPSISDNLYSDSVTKSGKSWAVSSM